jgi:Domain of unknown function (DUF4267)
MHGMHGRDCIGMIVDIGYYLSAAIALTLVLVGVRFFVAPYVAAEGFGVAVIPDARWDAYLSVKAIRDIGAGIFAAILILNRSSQLLGLFLLATTTIPLTDALIVLKHGGTKTTAFGIHGVTAGIILITSGLLLFG